jgi:AcrR family transcriptional regulator
MARTLDHTAYALRRDEFIDVAQRFIVTKGYDSFSIQDVLDELGASKGAFYHYFGAKADLLDAVVERMVETASVVIEPILADPGLSAADKLHQVFGGIAAIKADNLDLVVAVVDVWMSDDNTVVREKVRRRQAAALRSILDRIVTQGIREGAFSVTSPAHAGTVLVALFQGAGEEASRLFLASRAGQTTFDDVRPVFAAYQEAFERILGAAPGTLTFVDESVLRFWFDPAPSPTVTPTSTHTEVARA